jgi:hypothetical protein
MRQKIQIILLATCVIIITLLPQPFPAHLLKADFQIYWSASYLLAQGENFSDPSQLLEIQQQLSGWDDKDNILVTWNPPWLLAWLIPFTFIEFDRASWHWFLINLTLLFTSTTLLWLLSGRDPAIRNKSWLGIVVGVLFLPTITTLLVGQITILVLMGIAGFLYFRQQEKPLYAGLFLSLTSIKPHLLYIILPVVFLDAFIFRRWRIIIGFTLPIIVGIVIAFLLRPTFLADYLLLMGSGQVLRYTPPTLSSMISLWLNWPWFKLVSTVLLLSGCLIGWWFYGRGRDMNWVNFSPIALFISVITAPYGWSFDVIVLLVPLLQCCVWMLEKSIPPTVTLLVSLVYILANGVMLYQRSLGVGEEAYFWFPLLLAGLYIWCRAVKRPLKEGSYLVSSPAS